jgi:hypothetical protein
MCCRLFSVIDIHHGNAGIADVDAAFKHNNIIGNNSWKKNSFISREITKSIP